MNMEDIEFELDHTEIPMNAALINFGDLTAAQLDQRTQFTPGEEWKCPVCKKQFQHRRSLLRHQQVQHAEKQHVCSQCQKTFTRKDALQRHMKTHNKRPAASEPLQLRKRQRVGDVTVPDPSTRSREVSALKKRVRNIQLHNEDQHIDPKAFLVSKQPEFLNLVSTALLQHELKVNCRFLCRFQKVAPNGILSEEKCFKTKNAIVLTSTDLPLLYAGITEKLLAEAEDFERKESGWTLESILALELRLNKFNPLRGSSYLELPQVIKAKRAIINVQNTDQRCFMWAVLSALHPVQDYHDHASRIHHYEPYVDSLDFTGIEFPVKLQDIGKFEKLNSLSLNVYGLTETHQVFPLVITGEEKPQHIDLIYLTTASTSHYAWIKDLTRLVSRQYSNHQKKSFICRRCLQFFTTEAILQKHQVSCAEHEAVRVVMPHDKWVCFKNMQHTHKVPFVIYADFECLTTPMDTCQPNPGASYSEAYQKHDPISFCYYMVSASGPVKEPYVYRGQDAAKIFMDRMKIEAEHIQDIYRNPLPMDPLTEQQQELFQTATRCYMCKGSFTPDNHKVLDHDHQTRKLRGVACNTCNLKARTPNFIPVIFHNLSGYDSHLFIKHLGGDDMEITVIPENTEKYISFSKQVGERLSLRFLDSFRFMASSLDQLARNLSEDKFHHLKQHVPATQVPLLLRKGVFPYDYVNHPDKFQDTQLPPREKFYSRLNEAEISTEDYQHAQHVWDSFQIANLGEYADLYVKADVLQLADIFETFRDVCMKTYGLDPAWYYTAPGLSWDAMLKKTDIRLELLTDYDMLLFVERGIRGGISQCSHRYAKANNYYMPNYDPSQPSNYLLYLDANNLYGWAMSQYLPLQDFKWIEPTTNVLDTPEDSPVGFILEVDLEYPAILHNTHADLPLAPETMTPPGCKENRLMTTLFDKKRYVVHYRNLQLYLAHGLKLITVHRILQFTQSSWLKPYIDLNTQLRTAAANEFEKNFYKLMNNAIFGKTMENIRHRVNVKLCGNPESAEKWIARSNFQDRTIFCESLAAFHMRRTVLTFNKPITIGMAILDLSKTLMYEFHYSKMVPAYGRQLKLNYMDTDSFIYSVETEDAYKDMKNNLELYDTSDYPADNVYGFPRINKKVLGKMKDEAKGEIMTEFVGLRSKMYAYKIGDQNVTKKLKGIKKTAIERRIEFSDYKQCLFERQEMTTRMNLIRSKHHDVFSITLNKLALSPYDQKRHIMENGVHTLPFGHYSLEV